ncbi:MAG: hypothetical protein QW597_04255 [Thermoplasmataceae archaeon]
MVKTINLTIFEERKKFEIKLQASLRSNALKIKAQSKHPERFDEYISQRDSKIRELVGTAGEIEIFDGEKKIYP